MPLPGIGRPVGLNALGSRSGGEWRRGTYLGLVMVETYQLCSTDIQVATLCWKWWYGDGVRNRLEGHRRLDRIIKDVPHSRVWHGQPKGWVHSRDITVPRAIRVLSEWLMVDIGLCGVIALRATVELVGRLYRFHES